MIRKKVLSWASRAFHRPILAALFSAVAEADAGEDDIATHWRANPTRCLSKIVGARDTTHLIKPVGARDSIARSAWTREARDIRRRALRDDCRFKPAAVGFVDSIPCSIHISLGGHAQSHARTSPDAIGPEEGEVVL